MFGAVAEGTYPECRVSDVVALDKEVWGLELTALPTTDQFTLGSDSK